MLPHLSFIAEFSKTVSIFVVLLLLVLMMAYLSRVSVFPDFLPGSSSSVTWVQRQGISQQTMLLTPNPFQLQLSPDSTANTAEEPRVSLRVSVHGTCQCVCWWGVELRDLHTLLTWPWTALRGALLGTHQRLNETIYLYSEPLRTIDDDTILELKVPNVLQNGDCLGAPQRHRCPLVVILLVSTGEDFETSANAPARVVALVSVVHVRDAQVPMPTCILSQFLKQSNGQVTTLQPLYVSGVSSQCQDEERPVTTPSSERPQSEICCIVCHCNPATLALLPCRHACLCPHCLPRLSNCPLCRASIQSYFYVVQAAPTADPNCTGSNLTGQQTQIPSDTEVRQRNMALPS